MRIVRRNDQDRRPAAQLEGFTQEPSRNRIAPELATEWAKAVKAKKKAWTTGVNTHEPQTYNCSPNVHVDGKTSRGEEKKRKTSPKPMSINEQTTWKCGVPSIWARVSLE